MTPNTLINFLFLPTKNLKISSIRTNDLFQLKAYPESNIVAIDYDPGASEVNQLNRIKLMLSTAFKNMNKKPE